jgi:hypothetical protein
MSGGTGNKKNPKQKRKTDMICKKKDGNKREYG